MTDTMDVITTGRKGKHLNTLERYHIYRTRENLHMNDTYIDTHNPIFKALQDMDKKLQYTPHPSPSPSTITWYKNDRLYTSDSHNMHPQGTVIREETTPQEQRIQ
jgi:hypothetical protein